MSDTNRRMHKELKDIPSEYFPIFGETLGYMRGLPQFRQRPEFSEEGVLVPTDEGPYTYKRHRRRATPLMPANSELFPTMEAMEEDNPPHMSPRPCRNGHEIGGPSYSPLWPQTSCAPAQTPVVVSTTSLPVLSEGVHLPYEISDQSDMEGVEEQALQEAIFALSTAAVTSSESYSTSAPHNTPGPVSLSTQAQSSFDHHNPRIFDQSDIQMLDWLGYNYLPMGHQQC